jgi:hypothetical protein
MKGFFNTVNHGLGRIDFPGSMGMRCLNIDNDAGMEIDQVIG